jgi:predicted small secreted protein
MKSISKKLVLICVLSSIVFLNGCGTVNGVGQDVSSVGHGLQRAAN